MPPFRWPELKMYIDLAREVAGNNSQKPAEWEALAARLSAAFSSVGKPGVELKGKGCRERLDNLVEKYKAEDARSLNSRYKPSSCCNIGLHLPRVPLVVLGNKSTKYLEPLTANRWPQTAASGQFEVFHSRREVRRRKIQGGLPGAEHSRPVLISTQFPTLKRKLAVSATYVGPCKDQNKIRVMEE